MRFLLARPDHLGDVLLTLPAANALKRAAPDAHVTYLVATPVRDAPALSRDVDEVLAFEFPPPGSNAAPPEEVVRREASRLAGRFDAAVMLRPDDRWSAAFCAAARIPVRTGFSGSIDPFLTSRVSEPRGTHAVRLAGSLVADAAAALGVHVERPSPADVVPLRIPDGGHSERPTAPGSGRIVLHPGSGWALKSWPFERWVEVARVLRDHGELVVAGSGGDRALVERVAAAARVRGLVGLELERLATLHRGARLVVSVDSGAVHLAALVGTPVVGLYGPGDPALAAPWCPPGRGAVVRIELPCSPCGVMEDPPCGAVREPACMTGISVDDVAASVGDVVERAAFAGSA